MKEYLKKISLVLATCTFLFSCDKFLEENPKDKLPEDDVYNSISEVYLNAVASLYTYVGGYSDSQGLQGTGRGCLLYTSRSAGSLSATLLRG